MLGFQAGPRPHGSPSPLVCSACHNKYHRLGGLKNRHLFLTLLGAGSPGPRCRPVSFLVRAHFLVHTWPPDTPRDLTWWGKRALVSSSYKAPVPLWGVCPYTTPNPNYSHLPTPSSHWGLGLQCELEGHKICNIPPGGGCTAPAHTQPWAGPSTRCPPCRSCWGRRLTVCWLLLIPAPARRARLTLSSPVKWCFQHPVVGQFGGSEEMMAELGEVASST